MSIKFRKGDTAFFRARGGTSKVVVESFVVTAHRDGSVTLKAQFTVDETGERQHGYLGYVNRRVSTNGLYPSFEALTQDSSK